MVELTTVLLLTGVALAGGAFGAALGALPSFGLAGLLVVAGEVANLGRAADPLIEGGTDALGSYGLTGSVALGPGLGPHVAFAGGAAAAAYAARHGRLDTGFGYHEAKNVSTPLGSAPDVLLVGAAFGAVGYLLFYLSNSVLALPFDPVAFGIVASAFLHRIAFGYPLVGEAPEGLLEMTPYERGARREPVTRGDDPTGTADGARPRRLLVEPWLPHQSPWPNAAALGAAVGVFSAFLSWATASPFLGFGITAASLLFIALGMERFPVTYHMALPAGLLVVALVPGATGPGLTPTEVQAAVPLWQVVLGGAVMGLLAGLAGELCQRVLYAHADTHLDPPAAAILLTTLLIALLDIAELLEQTMIPTLGL